MKIIINSEEELKKVAEQAIHILANLRKFTRLWNESHGVELNERKKYYENKADELIEELKIKEHRNPSQININFKNKTNE